MIIHVIKIALGPLRLFWQDWGTSGEKLILELMPVFTHRLLSLGLVTQFPISYYFFKIFFQICLVRSLLGTYPLTYTPLSPPLLCKEHGENGPNISQMPDEVLGFILSAVSERLITLLKIS